MICACTQKCYCWVCLVISACYGCWVCVGLFGLFGAVVTFEGTYFQGGTYFKDFLGDVQKGAFF